MRADAGHQETDQLLAEIERRVRREYQQAAQETQKKLDDYLRRFLMKDDKWREWVASGEKTAQEYAQWRRGQIMVGKRWEEMRDTLAQDYHNANVIARSIVAGYLPEVYAINHNFATYQVERGASVDTSYTLYDRQTVERLLRDNPDLLPPPGKRMNARIAAGKDIRWQKGQIQSVTLQSILQGESIPNMAKRIAREMGDANHKATIRYARTAVTGAENAGRQNAYHRAADMGIEMKRVWIATLDNRTRHEHRTLDGQERGLDEPFENELGKIMYPGDITADPANFWNCRCTTIVQIKGFERNVKDLNLRRDEKLGEMTYQEWLEAKPEYQRITKQEETGKAMAGAYIAEYKATGNNSVANGSFSDIITDSKHASERKSERNVSNDAVNDALKNPLYIGDRIIDGQGRPSVKYIGREATVCLNPDTGVIATTWKTGKQTRKKYEK